MPPIARTAVLDVPHAVAPRGNPLSAAPNWVDPTYDAAGNMTYAPRPGNESCSCEALLFVYDGWNRLARAYEDANGDGDLDVGTDALIAQYQYDGRNRRITKTVGETATHFFFNESWQVLETRVGAGPNPLDQYLWDIRYIDAAVVRFHDAGTNGSYEDAGDNILYYTQDANFNTTALVDEATGDVVERYLYDPYGKVDCLDQNWTNGQATSRVSNAVLYTGHPLDEETMMVYGRWRYYLPTLGVWLNRDPWEYSDGASLYQYARSSPCLHTDSFGTATDPIPVANPLRGKFIIRKATAHYGTDQQDKSGGLTSNPGFEVQWDPAGYDWKKDYCSIRLVQAIVADTLAKRGATFDSKPGDVRKNWATPGGTPPPEYPGEKGDHPFSFKDSPLDTSNTTRDVKTGKGGTVWRLTVSAVGTTKKDNKDVILNGVNFTFDDATKSFEGPGSKPHLDGKKPDGLEFEPAKPGWPWEDSRIWFINMRNGAMSNWIEEGAKPVAEPK